jgi:transposase
VIVGHGIIKEGDINAMSREVEGTKLEKKKKSKSQRIANSKAATVKLSEANANSFLKHHRVSIMIS